MVSSLYVCVNFLMNYPAAEQRGINRNIHNCPKGRVIKTLSADSKKDHTFFRVEKQIEFLSFFLR
jgi:hypothetical protein